MINSGYHKGKSGDGWVYILLIFIAGILLYPVIVTGETSFFIKQDNLHQAYPEMNKLTISLYKGYLPIWDANTYGGKNLSGDFIPGIFYPLNIIWCLIFGNSKGINTYSLDLLVVFHYLICLLGMYNVARVFRLSVPASVASALMFTFTSALGARAAGQTCIFYGLALMPWSIYFVAEYYLFKRLKRYLIFAGLIAGLEILAGHIQPYFHTVMISAMMILYYEFGDRHRWMKAGLSTVINISIFLLFAVIITLPQLYYSSQYMSQCYRTVSGGVYIGPGQKVPLFIYSHWFIISLSNLGNFLSQRFELPNDDNTLYMGILPLFLAGVYLVWFRARKVSVEHARLTKLLIILLVVGILSALGYVTMFYVILYQIPFVNLVRQLGRYIILISFSASLLTGLAITYLDPLKEWLFKNGPKPKTYLMGGASCIAFLGVFFLPLSVSVPFLLTFLFVLGMGLLKMPICLPILSVFIIFVDLLLNPVGYLSTQTAFYPDYFYARNKIVDSLESSYGKYRVMFDMDNYALVRRNLGELYAIQTKWGYGATIDTAYADFTRFDQPVPEEVNDLLNVRYVITDKRLDSTCTFIDSTRQFKLYERRNCYPRCYWKHQLGEKGKEIEHENSGSIDQLSYSDLDQTLSVECQRSDTLIFSENYYPGWQCFDNGKEIKIYPAAIKNYPRLFRSIALDPGKHVIEFKYKKVFYWF